MGEEIKIDLVSSPKKSFWKLTVPFLGFVLFNELYSIIDMYWISIFDANAFYAVGVSIPIFILINSIGDSIGRGTNSLMSRSIGADEYENAYNTLIHGLLISFVAWILIIISLPFLDDMIGAMRITNSVNLVKLYLTPLFLFSIVIILANLFPEAFQSEGDSKTPTIIIIASNILNLILDPIFIFYFKMGVEGAIYATLLSSALGVAVFFYLYLTNYTKIFLKLKYFTFRPHIIFEILKVAVSTLPGNAIYCISTIFINSVLISGIGEIGVIIYATSCKLQSLLVTPVRAYGKALLSVSGHLFGSKKIDEIKDMYYYALKIAIASEILILIPFVFFRDYIFYAFQIFGMNEAVTYIVLLGSVIVLSITVIMISSKILDGFGKSYYSLALDIANLITTAVLIWLLNNVFLNGSSVLIGILIADLIFAGSFNILLNYMFKKMKRQKEEEKLVVI